MAKLFGVDIDETDDTSGSDGVTTESTDDGTTKKEDFIPFGEPDKYKDWTPEKKAEVTAQMKAQHKKVLVPIITKAKKRKAGLGVSEKV